MLSRIPRLGLIAPPNVNDGGEGVPSTPVLMSDLLFNLLGVAFLFFNISATTIDINMPALPWADSRGETQEKLLPLVVFEAVGEPEFRLPDGRLVSASEVSAAARQAKDKVPTLLLERGTPVDLYLDAYDALRRHGVRPEIGLAYTPKGRP